MSRILQHHASPARRALIRASAGTAVALLALTAAACGSASSQTSTANLGSNVGAASLGSAVQQDCTSLAGVLANGPDPGADPVGYAQAQVLPLRHLAIGDAALHTAVLSLASAYETFTTSTSSTRAASSAAVNKAQNEVNKICPQAVQ